ncbi:DNA-binding FadR family transcriptional regulator [Agromyces hippuratus]|uniref:DNA-binding FadR family transcriptional regulator n=1 Tax=Agromyces hippuratus TaxID=286438 RepID=A0A852WXE1_9MICO|nr:FCD domain-containing protein [Agromyces hippuratus]NYG22238.1 DNA-binding FadR family transcriptional regulator [Agromyces hippuratus]
MSAIDDAFHGLRHIIASGELAPGQRFPPEAELCERLGVSRGSLREAVRMLDALGVIESRHGSGTYVSALEPANIIGALSLTVELMPFDAFIELYEVRRVLESHAAAQAAARMTDAGATELRDILDELEAREGEQGTELDALFHETIAKLAGNAALVELLRTFRSRSRAYQVFDLPSGPDMKQVSDRGHREILSALVNRDPASAEAAAAAHVAQTEQWLRTHRPAPVARTMPAAS